MTLGVALGAVLPQASCWLLEGSGVRAAPGDEGSQVAFLTHVFQRAGRHQRQPAGWLRPAAVPMSHIVGLLVSANVLGVKWYLFAVSICISLIAKEAGIFHMFMFVFPLL